MTNHLMSDLQACGYITRTTQLRAAGHSRSTLDRAIAEGRLFRICGNWVATAEAPLAGVIAVLHRGKLTGPAALASYGIWDALDRRIHIRLARNTHGPVRSSRTPLGTFTAGQYPRTGVQVHWRDERHPEQAREPWRVSVIDALIEVALDFPREQFLACVESALCTRQLSLAGLPVLFDALPKRFAELRRMVDPRAESGQETLARLRISTFVQDVRTQVWISGIGPGGRPGRVDLLLDGWLVIELDGDGFHDPAADRRRNAILVRLGYRVHRFGFDQVINHWDEVEATIRELLRYAPAA